MKVNFLSFLGLFLLHEVFAFKRSWTMHCGGQVFHDDQSRLKVRRHIPAIPLVKILKRNSSTAGLVVEPDQIRPFKRQALEESDSVSSELSFSAFELGGESGSSEENVDLSELFSSLKIKSAVILCPYSVPSFEGVSLVEFCNELNTASPTNFDWEKAEFTTEAMGFFEMHPLVQRLFAVFEVSNLASVFAVCKSACPYAIHAAMEQALTWSPDWINPILSVILELCPQCKFLEKTASMLVEIKATKVEYEILKKVCSSGNIRFSPETYSRWIRMGVNNNTLAFIISYSTINESVLEAAIEEQKPSLLISFLIQRVESVSPSLVAKAVKNEYPENIINQLLGACSCPHLIQAARRNPRLFDKFRSSNSDF